MKSKSRYRLFSFILFIVVCVVVFNKEALWGYTKYRLGLEKIHLEKMHQIISAVDEQSSSDPSFKIIDENIIVIRDKKISLFDKLGEIQWEKEVLSDNIEILGNSQVILIVDREKGDIYTIDYLGNIVGEKYGVGTIIDVEVSEVAVTTLIEEENKIVNLDLELNELGVLDVPFGSVIRVATSKYEKVVSVNHLEIKDGTIDNKVFTYNHKGELLSGLNFEDKLVYGVKIIDDNIIVISEDKVIAYNYKTNESWEHKIENTIYSFEISDTGKIVINLVVPYDGMLDEPDEYKLIGFNIMGEIIIDMASEKRIDLTTIGTDQILIAIEKEIRVIDYQGNTMMSEQLGNNINSIKWLNSKSLIVEFGNFAEIYELTY